MHVRKLVLPTLLAAVVAPLPFLGLQAEAAPAKCRKACDTTAPVVSIATPGAGSTVTGTVTVSGSSSDNKALDSVAVSVDGGAWTPATGTTSWTWQWATGSLPAGTHTVTAKAVDRSGNVQTASRTVTVSTATADTTAPSVGFSSPAAGSTVSGTVNVTGTSADNASVAKVEVKVDSGAWQTASGTTSWGWSWPTAGLAAGTHTLTARATDAAGNVSTATRSFSTGDASVPSVSIASPTSGATVSGTVNVTGAAGDNAAVAKVEVQIDGGAWLTVSGTSAWSWSWSTTTATNGSHTIAARATDSSGNTASTSRTVTVMNSTSGTGTTWTSPEGVRIEIQTTTGGWTPSSVYSILKANALELNEIGPNLRVVVQDTKPTLSTVGAGTVNGVYTSFSGTIQLDARSTSTFSIRPNDIFTHEYGHVWFNYHAYLDWQGDWSAYLAKRWASTGGSTTLATDSRTGSSYIWTPDEIAADDYRLLFGTAEAIAERNASLNQQIPDPRAQTALRDWLLQTWAN